MEELIVKRKLLLALMSASILAACNNDEDSASTTSEDDTEVADSTTDESEESQDADSGASETQEGASNDELEDQYDVVIVGAGGGGMAAAIEAHDNGASVAIFEKMPIVGGNTLNSSGGMNAAESKVQEEEGIEDNVDVFFEETLEGGHGTNDQDLLRFMVDHSAEGIEWLDSLGIELGALSFSGGMSQPRAHRPTDGSPVGGYLVDGLYQNIQDRDIPVFLNSEVSGLIEDEGSVTGVYVNVNQTEETEVLADSVVIAAGGYGANFDMITQYDESITTDVTTNHEGATGDGILMAQEVGADVVDMDQIQVHPTVHQEDGYLISESIRGEGAILVNESGERFADELQPRDIMSGLIMEQENQHAYVIGDQELRERASAVDHYDEQGLLVTADTIEELAEKLDMNPDVLSETLDKWNEAVANQDDKEFGRTTAMDYNLENGPFFAANIAPGIHHTMGGLKINTSTEVLNTDGQAIPNLYAAGEVTGGVHGGNRIGGNAVTDIIIFGREAGKSASENAKN